MTNAELSLLRVLIRMNTAIMAALGALFGGAGLWLATAILLMRGGDDIGRHLSLLSIFLPGYEVSWDGALIRAFWGALIGATSGAVVYWS